MNQPVITVGAKPFRAGQGHGEQWASALKAALDALGPLTAEDNFGCLYVGEGLADDFSSIVTFLRETTPVHVWAGGIGMGVIGPVGAFEDGLSVALLVGSLPADQLRPFARFETELFRKEHGDWLAAHRPTTALVHGDPRDPELIGRLAELATDSGAFLVGGLMASAGEASQLAGRLAEEAPGLAGVLFDPQVEMLSGLTQGCSPVGPVREITAAMGEVVMELDGQPALAQLKEDCGEIIARDLRRAAGYIHAGLPIPHSDHGDYVVRNLIGIDPQRGWIAVGAQVEQGERMMFVRRDPETARIDLARMLGDLRRRLAGRQPRGGLYVTCVARGAHMFGDPDGELALIRELLGNFPLIGFSANGEISHDRLYAYTGVLTLFL